MKFYLIDKIESIEPGKRIVTSKALSLAEEYLADHFPTFPVLPGVLMLEAITQSAAWLVRLEQDYANSIIILKKAQNVRYAHFVSPGNTLRCEVEALSIEDNSAKFKASAYVQEKLAVSAKLQLDCFNLADRPALKVSAETDIAVVAQLKQQFELMGGPAALAAARTEV
jgi:3-hydroxyacyl-[acyl-carrier-protein] dehydratase